MVSTLTILVFSCWLTVLRAIRLCDNSHQSVVISAPGDIIIGGIFAIHGKVELVNRTQPGILNCSDFRISRFFTAQVMVHRIKQINNSSMLRGIKLGYEIHDSCTDVIGAVQAAMKFLSKFNSSENSIGVHCNYTNYVPAAKVIVGSSYSEISIVIARMLNLYLIPQISYGASAEILSDKTKFGSFFRVVPSDKHQTMAIAKLIVHFKWNWVGVIATADDYGQSALNSFILHAQKLSICVDFRFLIPTASDEDQIVKLREIATKIQNSTAEVMVTFIRSSDISELFKLLIKKKVKKTWIASDTWSDSRSVANMMHIEEVGTILGITFKSGKIPNFAEYLEQLQTHPSNADDFTKEYLRIASSNTSSHEISNKIEEANTSFNYGVYLTINAIVYALKRMLNCDQGKCNRSFDFPPWQMLNELKNVKFMTENGQFQFDSSGDYSSGYDIVYWKWMNGSIQFVNVGDYNVTTKLININADFNQIAKVGEHRCSETCKPGQRKTITPENNCCYSCSICTSGTYSKENDSTECMNCSENYWSNTGSSTCQKATVNFVQWKDPLSIVLIIFAILGTLIVCVVSILITKHLNTPAVKAAGGWMCYIMLLSLVVGLVSSILFIGEPHNLICLIRQPLFGISFTLCVSCILIKSFRVILAFSFNPTAHKNLKLFYKPVPIIVITTGVQVVICTVWLSLNPPKSMETRANPQIILKLCDEGSPEAFGIMLGYIALLAFICFILAYRGRKAPKMYNEARLITFSMLVYVIVWISFGIVHFQVVKNRHSLITESIAILASIYSILCCHFIPTCYVVYFKKESNVESNYLTHAREHFKQKGQFVCPVIKMQRHSRVSIEEQLYPGTEVRAGPENECSNNQQTEHTNQNKCFKNHRVASICLRKRHRSC
ncbi:G-protein coupled receptor family C group 6 member A-like [Amblyraja radiata]|uniref:G-protein coupled receptor family C group 6 member A-like n=1 Tax=Amblyraja radiata TaxID=386614 RepID=UPI0014025026|nr:G-protein coupled receptor family C group 6 member A-like [Amblyraja radiata]